MSTTAPTERPTLFGHPTALFMLFFAEMWERFSYYGMRALLVLYMIKGFLNYEDKNAYVVYGAYTALVYMTPFIGGMIADRLLGARRAVVLGGLLMAAGHLVMGIEQSYAFFTALALLIVGNGFFKPNISTIVGNLYPDGDPRRDGGFTIFYMGINLGAAAAPLLCGLVGETLGWHYGFGLATLGMLVGLAIFVLPSRVASFMVLAGALITGSAMILVQSSMLLLLVNTFVAVCLFIAGVVAFIAMGKEGLQPEDGGAPDPVLLKRFEIPVYIGAILVVPLLAGLVWANINIEIVPGELIQSLTNNGSTLSILVGTLLHEVSRPAGLVLLIVGFLAIGYLAFEAIRSPKIERERLFVVLILMFFSMLFWAFFEQAGSSVNNFTDRNVDRVFEARTVQADEVGSEITFRISQEQLGYSQEGDVFTIDDLDALRAGEDQDESDSAEGAAEKPGIFEQLLQTPPAVTLLTGSETETSAPDPMQVTWKIDESHVGMGLEGSEVPASTFQAANPIFILLFGIPFAMLWTFLGRIRLEPNTSLKFALGLLQLGLGFGALWYGATFASTDRGMVWMGWLLLGYLLHTTGELCLSPVGLSMVTKLSPKRLVSTVMGGWFLATAFSAYLAAIIATFTAPAKAKPHADEAKPADTTESATSEAESAPAPAPSDSDAPADTDPPVENDESSETDSPASPGDTDASSGDTDQPDTDAPGSAEAPGDTDSAVTPASEASPADDGSQAQDAAPEANEASEAEQGEELSEVVEAKEPIPPPIETVHVYGYVFGTIALAAVISSILLALVSPLLQYWMHEGKEEPNG